MIRNLAILVMLIMPSLAFSQGKITRPKKHSDTTIEIIIPQSKWSIDYKDPYASEVEKGLEYQSQGLDEKAISCFKLAANNGNLDAMRCLGGLYSRYQKYSDALSWYTKAAERGDAGSEYMLGEFYYEGLGVSNNYTKALNCYEKAAKHNVAEAQRRLGEFYYNGIVVDSNKQEAKKWYTKAAMNGDIEAVQCIKDKYGVDISPDILLKLSN